MAQSLLIDEVSRSHTTTHHSRSVSITVAQYVTVDLYRLLLLSICYCRSVLITIAQYLLLSICIGYCCSISVIVDLYRLLLLNICYCRSVSITIAQYLLLSISIDYCCSISVTVDQYRYYCSISVTVDQYLSLSFTVDCGHGNAANQSSHNCRQVIL
jgi:hypothetical protein